MSREMLSLALNENKRHQWNNKSVSSLQSREGKYTWVVDLPTCTAEDITKESVRDSESTREAQNR